MAITATLMYAGRNRLRYLIAATAGAGEAVTITTTGAASPDLVTDSLAGPIKNLANAHDNGYGLIPAGALTQAMARALWNSEGALATVGPNLPTAMCRLSNRTTATADPVVDANVSAGEAVVVVTANGIGTSYLDIGIPGAIGF